MVAVALAGIWYHLLQRSAGPAETLKVIPFTTYPGSEVTPAFSPDGKQIAFAWDGENGDNFDIYVRLIDSGPALRLTTDPAPDTNPVWSSDGSRIAFLRQSADRGGVFVVSSLGGPERRLDDLLAHTIDWSRDGRFLAASSGITAPFRPNAGPLFLIDAGGGGRKQLTAPPDHVFGDAYPAFSPDGRTLAFTRVTSGTVDDLYVAPVAGGEPRRLTSDERSIRGLAWTPDGGSVVFASNRGGSFGLWRIRASGGVPNASRSAPAASRRRFPGRATGSHTSNRWTIPTSGAWKALRPPSAIGRPSA